MLHAAEEDATVSIRLIGIIHDSPMLSVVKPTSVNCTIEVQPSRGCRNSCLSVVFVVPHAVSHLGGAARRILHFDDEILTLHTKRRLLISPEHTNLV